MPTIFPARGISVNFYTFHASYVSTLDSEIVLPTIKSKKLKYSPFSNIPTFCISYCQTDVPGNMEHLKAIDYTTFGVGGGGGGVQTKCIIRIRKLRIKVRVVLSDIFSNAVSTLFCDCLFLCVCSFCFKF